MSTTTLPLLEVFEVGPKPVTREDLERIVMLQGLASRAWLVLEKAKVELQCRIADGAEVQDCEWEVVDGMVLVKH